MHLRATSPAVAVEQVNKAIDIMNNTNATSLKSVEKLELLAEKTFVGNGMVREDDNTYKNLKNMSNNIEESSNPSAACSYVYAQTAAVDIYRRNIIETGKLWGENCIFFECGSIKGDINTGLDLSDAYREVDRMNLVNQNEKMPTLCFDLDGVIFLREKDNDYEKSKPNEAVISMVNELHTLGCYIKLHSARGAESGIDWEKITIDKLNEYGVLYHELTLTKPSAEIYIDDKAWSLSMLRKYMDKKSNNGGNK